MWVLVLDGFEDVRPMLRRWRPAALWLANLKFVKDQGWLVTGRVPNQQLSSELRTSK